MHRLHRDSARLEHVGIETAAAGLDHRALHDVFRAGAPKADLDAILLLECGDERRHVVGRRRAVDGDGAFLLRSREEPLHAIRAGIGRQVSRGRLTGLRRCGHALRARAQEREQASKQENEQESKQECKPLHRRHGLWPRCRRLLSRGANAAPLHSSGSLGNRRSFRQR